MKNINELIENDDLYQKMLVQRCFDSKKNTVCYVIFNGTPRVIKWYPPGLKKNMDTEYTILKKGAKTLNIPTVFKKDEKNIVLIQSYISGINLCDYINDPQIKLREKENTIQKLADWFVKFHDFFKTTEGYMIRGDAILRNFILKEDVWGVDFEEARLGKPIEDIARITASILSTEPMFTDEKYQLGRLLIDIYQQNSVVHLDGLNEELSYALLEISQWRPEQEELLRKYAQKIKIKGLKK
ncbi:MAG: hypothetical protein QXL17_01130 [Candidatus Thermoplasmatota archaeon]